MTVADAVTETAPVRKKLSAPVVSFARGIRRGMKTSGPRYHLDAAAQQYAIASKDKKTEAKAEWSRKMAEHSADLFPFAQVTQVLPKRRFRNILEDVHRNLFVHRLDTVEEMIAKRVPIPGMNKDLQAFYVPGLLSPDLTLSAVFRYQAEAQVDPVTGLIYSDTLASDVDVFKDTPPTPLTGKENTTVHYELISNRYTRKSSEEFVKRGLVDTGDRLKVTASPGWGVYTKYSPDRLLEIQQVDGPDGIRTKLIEYLRDKTDAAGDIHMRNGATVAAIGFTGSNNRPVVNYVYDPEVAADNADMYVNYGEIPVTEALHRSLGAPEGTQAVQSNLLAPTLMGMK